MLAAAARGVEDAWADPTSCTLLRLDDGYGAVPDTYVDGPDGPLSGTQPADGAEGTTNGAGEGAGEGAPFRPTEPPTTDPRLVLGVVAGDLCAAKTRCTGLAVCGGFVWRPGAQEATLLRRVPPPHTWRRARTPDEDRGSSAWASAHAKAAPAQPMLASLWSALGSPATGSPATGSGHRSLLGHRALLTTRHPPRREQATRHRPQTAESPPPPPSTAAAKPKKVRKDAATLRREAKDRATALAGSLQAGAAIGPVLYVKLATGDTLTQLLARHDESPSLQQVMSGYAAAPAVEAVLRSNGSVVSGSGLAGHPRAQFDVFRTAGEWWTDFTKVGRTGRRQCVCECVNV